MGRLVRDGSGLTLVLAGLGVLFWAISQLSDHDYLASLLALLTGLGVLRAGVELLRPTVGE